MKKDLNLLKVKDVTIKSASKERTINAILLIIAIVLIAGVALFFFKTYTEFNKLNKEKDDYNTKITINQSKIGNLTLQNKKNAYLDKSKALDASTADMLKTINTIDSYKNTLNYGVLSSILENPNGDINTVKGKVGSKTFRNMLEPSNKPNATPEEKSFLQLQTSKYEIDGNDFRANLSFNVIYPKYDVNPKNEKIDIYNKDYVLNVYKDYLDTLIIDPLKDTAYKDKISGIDDVTFSPSSDSVYDAQNKANKRTFTITITIPSADYNSIIDILNNKYLGGAN